MATGDLCTLASVKAYLGLTVNTDDALLGQLITAASAWIKEELCREIISADFVDTLDGTGGPRICVPQFPITAIASITVAGQALPVASVVFKRMAITRVDGATFPRGLANVVVSYTAGFAAAPADIAQACVELVAWRYKEREHIGQSTKSAGGQETVAYQTSDAPANVKTLLRSWKKVVPV